MTWMAWVLAMVWILMLLRSLAGRRRTLSLGSFRGHLPRRYPRVSVVIPACNEQSTLEAALESVLALDYPDYEVILVEDRSTDGTRAVAERLARSHDALRVLPLDELPPGWLGKTHALHQGGLRASGELILFTDADVHFGPTSLRAAVQAMIALRVDHLVVQPRMVCRGFWEQLVVSYFLTLFALRYSSPWACEPDDRVFVGIGAFNLVRASTYRALGGHQPIALQVADDVGLGRQFKRHGCTQHWLDADGQVQVRWVEGLRGLVTGLEKNAYAGLDYSPWQTLSASAASLVLTVGPLATLAWGGWAAWLIMAAWPAGWSTGGRVSPGIGLFFPAAGAVLAYTMVRSAWLAERRGGIMWRGTFYPLELLRGHTLNSGLNRSVSPELGPGPS